MENAVIRFRAKGQNLSLVSGYNRFAGNTIGYIRIEIEPDDEWRDFDAVDALFQNDQGKVSAVLFYDSGVYACNAPVEMTAASSVVFLNLSGKNVVNNVLVERLTTYPIFAFAIDRDANVTSYRETEVSPNMYEQYIAAVGNQVEKITDLTVSAHEADEPEVIKTATPGLPINLDFGLVRGETGEQGIPGEQGIQGEPGVPGEKGDPFTYDDFTEEQIAALVGPQGPRGLTGSAAGFGTVSATVDNNEGDPSVTVATSGPSTAKNINFEFKNLKGEKGDPFTYDDFTPEQLASLKGEKGDNGDTGATPNLSIGTVETLPPTGSSEVTITGTAENSVLNFKLVKGDTGEVSQAEFDEAVSDLKSDLTTFKGFNYTVIAGSYVGKNDGAVSSLGAYCVTDFIECSNIDIAVRTKVGNDISGICFYDKNKTYISGYNPYSDNEAITKLTKPSNTVYVRVSCLTSYSANLFITPCDIVQKIEYLSENKLPTEEFDKVVGTTSVNPSFTSREYIYASTGNVGTIGFDSLKASDFIVIPVATTEIDVYTAFVDSAGLAFYDANKSYISGVAYAEGHNDQPYLYKLTPPTNAKYFRFSVHTSNISIDDVTVNIYTTIKSLQNGLSELSANSDSLDGRFWSYALWKVLCIGDSLTSGANYTESWAGASIDENYPRILGRMLDADVVNGGVSGYSASQWYNNKSSDYNYSNYDTFIIWLGTNEGLTDTLDTDVNPYSDYHDYANTNTGNYCKIIEAIQSANVNCAIFLVEVFATSGDMGKDTVNEVIDKIATKYNLPVIDNSDLGSTAHPELHGNILNPHFSKAGNIFLANKFVTDIGEYISANPARADYGETARTN